MLNGSFRITLGMTGLTIDGTVNRQSATGIEPIDDTLPVGYAGALTTRTDNDTGTVTLSAGHSVTTGKVDVHWDGGSRYNMDGTVSVNALSIDGGAGDNLPAQSTAVVAQNPTNYAVSFDGDNLTMIGAAASRQARVTFKDGGGAVLTSVFIVAGGAWGWAAGMGTATPITGNAVASVAVSNGNSEYTSTFKLGGLQSL